MQNATITFTSTTVWLIWICRLFGASQLKRITRCRAHLVLWSAIMFNNETALIIDDWVVFSCMCLCYKSCPAKFSSPLSPRSIVPVRRLLFRLIEPSQTQCQYRSWTLFWLWARKNGEQSDNVVKIVPQPQVLLQTVIFNILTRKQLTLGEIRSTSSGAVFHLNHWSMGAWWVPLIGRKWFESRFLNAFGEFNINFVS